MEDTNIKKTLIIIAAILLVSIFLTSNCNRSETRKLSDNINTQTEQIQYLNQKLDIVEGEIMLQRIMISDKNNTQRLDSLVLINEQQKKHIEDYKQTLKNLKK